MPGVPGAGGPVPKRSDQRRRQNKPAVPITRGRAEEVEIPEADENWHPVARRWFDSLARSGQSFYYQDSDWATAVLIAESMSRDLKPQVVGITEEGEPVRAVIPLKGASLSAYLKAMTVLLVTEGDRRRLRLELERNDEPQESGSEVTELDSFRSRLAN